MNNLWLSSLIAVGEKLFNNLLVLALILHIFYQSKRVYERDT